MLVFLGLLACSDPVVPSGTDAPGPVEAPLPAPAPSGSIGGEPILEGVVVVGAIATSAVDAGVAAQMDKITACYTRGRASNPELSGKVLVRFTIDREGHVGSTTIRSTSLRHPSTEDCLQRAVAKAQFPPLKGGKIAVVNYPFVFAVP